MIATKNTVKEGPFSVVETGGKQFVVRVGDIITIEKISEKEYVEGDKIVLDSVLLTDDGSKTVVGTPEVKGAKITGEVMDSGFAKKVTIIHYRSKSRHFKKHGHRQPFIKLRVTSLA